MIIKAFLVGIHSSGSFRPGKPAEILGVVFITPTNSEERPCYHVKFDDGTEDFVPLSDAKNFKIISKKDVEAGKIPAVV